MKTSDKTTKTILYAKKYDYRNSQQLSNTNTTKLLFNNVKLYTRLIERWLSADAWS